MFDACLHEALRRLDRWLLWVCDAEEQRAQLLAGDGKSGWEGVRNLIRPEAARLLFVDTPDEFPLLPAGDHAWQRLGKALALEPCELEALLVILAAYLEPRYQALYAVLQDNLQQNRPTERLLLAVLGRTPQRWRTLSATLGAAGRLSRSGFIQRDSGSFPPLGRPLGLPEEVVAVLCGATTPPVPGAVAQHWAVGTGTEDSAVPCQVIYGAGDGVALAQQLVGAATTTLEVRVPAGLADALGVCQAAGGLASESGHGCPAASRSA
jgi:hypothetical protein